jgi:hypothetical protein
MSRKCPDANGLKPNGPAVSISKRCAVDQRPANRIYRFQQYFIKAVGSGARRGFCHHGNINLQTERSRYNLFGVMNKSRCRNLVEST